MIEPSLVLILKLIIPEKIIFNYFKRSTIGIKRIFFNMSVLYVTKNCKKTFLINDEFIFKIKYNVIIFYRRVWECYDLMLRKLTVKPFFV